MCLCKKNLFSIVTRKMCQHFMLLCRCFFQPQLNKKKELWLYSYCSTQETEHTSRINSTSAHQQGKNCKPGIVTLISANPSFHRAYFWGPWELGGEPVELDPGQSQQTDVHRTHREIRSFQKPSGETLGPTGTGQGTPVNCRPPAV